MRELNVMEINEVSGAGWLSALSSSILLGAVGFGAGAAFGGARGGDGGGILGIGSFGQLVGVIVGPVIGVASGAVIGASIGFNDPDTVSALATQWVNSVFNGSFV
ncbi:colicin V synthesis protein [Ewingella sp. S1.OA.A_B6]